MKMKTRIALFLFIPGILYVASSSLFILTCGNGVWTLGSTAIRLGSMAIPLNILWYICIASVILLIADEYPFSLDGALVRYGENNSSNTRQSILIPRHSDYRAALGAMFVLALVIRVYKIDCAPVDFHPTRQYNDAIIARDFYYGADNGWKKGFYNVNRMYREPPLMELAGAGLYRLAGGENLAIPRILSSLLWLIAAWALYKTMRKIASPDAALMGTAFFLFAPFAVKSSRCFMPDPLMITMTNLYILALAAYTEKPSKPRWYLAAMIASCAVFAKVSCALLIIASTLALFVFWKDGRKHLSWGDILLFSAVTILPTLAYSLAFLSARSSENLSVHYFLTSLAFKPFIFIKVIYMINRVVWVILLPAAIAGVLLLRGPSRILMLGLGAGYVSFCLIFNYHTATHDYYHMLLLPVVAIGLGKAGDFLVFFLNEKLSPPQFRILAPVFFLTVLTAFVTEGISKVDAKNAAWHTAIYERIGERVGHSRDTLILAPNYGTPLKYHGWVEGIGWLDQDDLTYQSWLNRQVPETAARLQKICREENPRYFIIALPDETEKHQALTEFLDASFPALVRDDSAIIYDLQGETQTPAAPHPR